MEGRDGGVRAHHQVQPGSLSLLAAIVAAALAASITGLRNWYAYDDVSLILFNPAAHSAAAVFHVWTQPYWPPGVGGLLYRPVTSALWALEWVVGQGRPLVFHVVNIALYVAVCVGVLALARRLLPPAAALIAAALFAVHPVHVEVVANCVGQGELVAALTVILATLVYLDHRDQATGRWTVALLYAIGILAKEHVVVLPLVLLAVEDPRPRRARLAALWPMAVALALCLAARYGAIGTLLGDSPDPVFAHASMATRLWTMCGVVTQWARLLVWPAHLSFSYNPPMIPVRTTLDASAAGGALLVACAVAVVVTTWRRAPVIALGLVWTAAFLAPVSNILFVSGVLLTERSLFLPSVGAVLAVGGALAAMRLGRGIRVCVGVAAAALVAVGAWRSAGRQLVWRNDHTLFSRGVIDAPSDFYAHYLWADQLFAEGNAVLGEREARRSVMLSGGYPPALALVADAYAKRGACDQAIPLWRRALGVMPWLVPPRVGLATCLLQTGAYADARAVAAEGVAHGESDAALRRVIGTADSVGRSQGKS